MENRIDFQISPEDRQAIVNAIEVISTKTPWRIVLSAKERKGGIRLGAKSFGHIEKVSDYMDQNPQLVSSYINVEAFKHDLNGTRDINEILRMLAPLVQSLEDTASLAGMEAMVTAMAFYNSVKVAAKSKVPGADVVYNDLKQRFANSGRKPGEPKEKS